ncbi:MAG: hypothetical protein ACI39C_04565 [Dietzia sp.]
MHPAGASPAVNRPRRRRPDQRGGGDPPVRLRAPGHSDISDLLFNTADTLADAVTARLAGQRLYPVWIGLALSAAVLAAIPVLPGPRLGDVDKVVEVAAPGGG